MLHRLDDHHREVVPVFLDDFKSRLVTVRQSDDEIDDGVGDAMAHLDPVRAVPRTFGIGNDHAVIVHAMPESLEDRDLVLTGKGSGGSHGIKRGLRSCIAKHDALGAGNGLMKKGGKRHLFWRVDPKVPPAARNPFDRGSDIGVIVSQDMDPETHAGVDVLVAVNVLDPRFVSFGNVNRMRQSLIRAHSRKDNCLTVGCHLSA